MLITFWRVQPVKTYYITHVTTLSTAWIIRGLKYMCTVFTEPDMSLLLDLNSIALWSLITLATGKQYFPPPGSLQWGRDTSMVLCNSSHHLCRLHKGKLSCCNVLAQRWIIYISFKRQTVKNKFISDTKYLLLY